MIITTSLSPFHTNKENQANAVDSWARFGQCYSFNSQEEIDILGPIYSINFIQTKKTTEAYSGKPLVSINEMFDFAIEKKESLLIINSDIILAKLPLFNEGGITALRRLDYSDNPLNATFFKYGFDVFYIPERFLTFFPPSVYGMGNCWWDLSIPYRAIKSNISIYSPKGSFAFHKTHTKQWSTEEWEYIGNFFKWEFKLNPKLTCGQIATQVMEEINSKL